MSPKMKIQPLTHKPMKKTTIGAALLAAMLGAASTTAPEVINNQPGISQQQGQRTAPNQNRNVPEQRVVVRQHQAVQNGLPFLPGFLAHESGLPPKYYGIRLQQTGRQWENLRVRRSRKYTG